MTISVIIPVFRVSAYIERCLDSVAHQTYTDVECIVVDDASDDDSMLRVSSWLVHYEGAVVFRTVSHDRNRGLSAARNTGIRAAGGEFVVFLDGDDALPPDSLEQLFRLVSRFPDVDIVQGSTEIIGPDPNALRYRLSARLPEVSRNVEWLGKSLLERRLIPVTSWNKLIRRSWLLDNNLLFKEGLLHEDEHWTYISASFVHAMAFCRHVTYLHYVTEGSIMRSQAERSIQSWMVILEDGIARMHDSLYGTRKKVMLEVGFCNLVRIVKKSPKDAIPENLVGLRQVMEPLFSEIRLKGSVLERWLIGWFRLPLPLLSIACSKNVKGIYLRLLDTIKA